MDITMLKHTMAWFVLLWLLSVFLHFYALALFHIWGILTATLAESKYFDMPTQYVFMLMALFIDRYLAALIPMHG